MNAFSLRRAIERLRDGLFDTVAVNRLTMEEEPIKKNFSTGLKTLEKGKSNHLCICGSYGQGKSHTLNYLNQHALSQGYATSFVQLDQREIPFHRFSVVYQSLMNKLSLPNGEKFAEVWKKQGDKLSTDLLKDMPHRFQMILLAMLSKNMASAQKGLKKNNPDLPKDFRTWLDKALIGHNIPLKDLKNIFKIQNIEGYQKQTLVCRENLQYVQMIQALGTVLKEMGYKGLVLFFDEAESITQCRIGNRAKSYTILDHFFKTKQYVYPIFAFTEDFFEKVKDEEYEEENSIFLQNYADAWKKLNIARLQDSSSDRWEALQHRLIQMYLEAYRIDLPHQIIEIKGKLQKVLDNFPAQETRFKLKALVHQLDIETQHYFLSI